MLTTLLHSGWITILAYTFGLILILLLGRLLVWPLKLILKLVYNALIGGLMLWIVNFIGGYFHFAVPLNPITALIAGFLGIPGVIMIIILQLLMV